MEKLLHERLRESTDNDGFCKKYTLANGKTLRIYERGAFDLADEIERYYIPRPRFEDGKPVQFDDEYIDHNGYNQTVSSLTYTKGNSDYVNVNGWHKQPLDEPLKRPAPKVLDADGVEIKVGDTVYNIENDGEQGTARCFYSYGVGVELAGGWRSDGVNPKYLTHERPVFDADGVRICNGDTVWDLNSGEKLLVVEFANMECGLVQCSNEDGDCEDHDAHNLTHREPDSLKKLCDDMRNTGSWSSAEKLRMLGFADRLTALMERDA